LPAAGFYWLGLRVLTVWPRFAPLVPQASAYTHWGIALPGGKMEPNNLRGLEHCAGANSSEAYNGAWGWSDEQCSLRAPFMCKTRGWRPTARLPLDAAPLLLPALARAACAES
jgi:hypothetical protein